MANGHGSSWRNGSSAPARQHGRSATPSSASSRLSELGSIVPFGIGVFVLIALFTYSPTDPSFFTNASGAARNACGKVGGYLASLLIECFGVGSFLVPAAFFFTAATVVRREGAVRLAGVLGGMTVSVMSLTVFLSLQWKYWLFGDATILTGGAFGAWFADKLMQEFNSVGSSIVSLVVFLGAIVISTPISVAEWGARSLRFASILSWRCLKVLGGYAVYLGGLLAMRLAHRSGDLIQNVMDRAVQQAKEKKLRRDFMKAEVPATPQQPEIGTDSDPDPDTAPNPDSFEAPNALPELESKAAIPSISQSPEISRLSSAPDRAAISPSAETGDAAADKAAQKLARAAVRASKRGQWKLPSLEFLRKPPKVESSIDRERLLQNSAILQQKFADFGIDGEVTAVRPGPVITLYEFKPGPGVKVSRIAALADDLSMALSAQSVRILAPLPGKSVVGIEIPSDTRETVFLREFLSAPDFHGVKHSIPVVMGKDIAGQPYISDLARMPHLLCAGQTGAGKSVFMNGLICSLFYRFTPDELRMILVDPKFIEFRAYQDIPHLLLPVVDDPRQASIALKWAVREMERRYRILAIMGARNLASFNQKIQEMGADVVRDLLMSEENQPEGMAQMSGGDWIEAFEPDETGAPRIGKLPYIVVIIDELADLMMIAKKEVEISIARIAQKARAAGIHLVIATQRPSTDVVTGLIKANLPSRVSFQLASYIDSKTILDRAGAERLLGQGDMLFIPPGVSQSLRLHGAFVDDEEINKIASFLRSQGKPAYRNEILVDESEDEDGDGDGAESDDELFVEAVELVKRSGHASASFLQRHLKVGYNRAARMIETMESRGIVGPADGARPREVLMRS